MASLLGTAYALAGRVAETRPLLEQAVEEATSSRLMYGQSLWVSLLGEGYLLAGRRDRAVPGHGYDVLAAPSGGGIGTSGGRVRAYEVILAMVAFSAGDRCVSV